MRQRDIRLFGGRDHIPICCIFFSIFRKNRFRTMVSTRRKKAAEAKEETEVPAPPPPPPPLRVRRSRIAKEKSATPGSRLKSKTPSVEEPEEVKECVKLGKDVEVEYCELISSKEESVEKEGSEELKTEKDEISIMDVESDVKPEVEAENSANEEFSPDIEQELEEKMELDSQSEPEDESQPEPEPEKIPVSEPEPEVVPVSEPEPEQESNSKNSSPMDISDNDEKEEEIEVPPAPPAPPAPKEPEFIEVEQPKYRRPHAFHPAAAAFEEEKELVKIPKPPVPPEEFLPIMGIKPIVLKAQTRPGTNPNPLLFSLGKQFGSSSKTAPPPPVTAAELPKPTFFNARPIVPLNPPKESQSRNPNESHSLTGPMIIAPAVGRRREEERIRETRPSIPEISTRISRRDGDRSNERDRPRRSSEREKPRRSTEREKSSRDDRYRDSVSSHYHRFSHRDDSDRRDRDRDREKDRRHSNNYYNHSRKYEPNNDRDRSRERRRDDRERSPPRREKEAIEKEEERKEKIVEKENIEEKKVEEKKEKEEEKVVEVEKPKSPTVPIEEMVVPPYELITECKYLTKNASKKKTLSLICECYATGRNCSDDDCVNRAMYTECPPSCPATKCKNQRFTRKKNSAVEAFHTGTKKGCGLRASKDIKAGQFILEYVGEMLERDDFADRREKYARNKKHKHHYFCDTGSHTIDATTMGNASRFINHSCNPNAVCEKWMVPKTPGAVNRIGFFAKRAIVSGEEITFDYQFVNYGRDAQECYCGSENCTGYIGERPSDDSSDEEDESDDELVTTDELDDEEQKIADLEFLSESERKEAIDEMLADVVVRNRRFARKVIQIAERMTNCEQRMRLIDEIFSQDTSMNTQSHYAEEGIGNLMYEWLSQQDLSVENLKLMQKVLQVLHGEVFVSVAKSQKGLLDVVATIGKINDVPEGINIQSVMDSLVTCVDTGDYDYHKVEENTHNEIMANFNRLREMAYRLNNHWFNRSVTFRIPKKVREPSPPPKASEKLPSLMTTSSREQSSSSYSQDVPSKQFSPQPRFFDSRSEYGSTIGGRYGGYRSYTTSNSNGEYYRGGNYNYRRKYPAHDNGSTTYFNQSSSSTYRKRSRYSRSRSRSASPTQSVKRHRNDDRRTPSDTSRKPIATPNDGERYTPTVSSSGDSSSKLNALSSVSNSSVHGIPTPAGPPPPPPNNVAKMAPPQPAHYDYPQQYDHTNPYAYSYFPRNTHHPMNIYPPGAPMNGFPHPAFWPPGHRPPLTYESLPTLEELEPLYDSLTEEQLQEHLLIVQQMTTLIHQHIARLRNQEKNASAIAAATAAAVAAYQQKMKQAVAEEIREPPPKPERYTWARAKAEGGETYYFNKVTKQTQWSPPSAEQGEVDPNDQTPPDTTQEDNKSQQGRQSSLQARIGELIENEPTEADKSRGKEEKEREIARQKVEAARQRQLEENKRVEMHKQMEMKTKEFKLQLEKVIAPIVKGVTRSLRTSTPEKVTWLVKQLIKEMFKRQSSEEGFTYSLTDTAKLKVKKYTESLMERKLKNGAVDIWKGYQSA